jgi:lipoprotein-anchoring transpeptidase ErfK/SrfK
MIRFPLAALASTLAVGVTAPAASPPLPYIASGVRLAGIDVGGLTSEQARARVKQAFDRPVRFGFYDRRWQVSAIELGANPHLSSAIARALDARPGARLKLEIAIERSHVRRYVARLQKRFSREPEDARLAGLQNLQPVITDARPGRKVDRKAMVTRIVHALRTGSRDTIALALRPIQPDVTAETFGPVIVIRRGSNRLDVFDGSRPWKTFPVATGQAAYPTPLGQWSIVDMQRNPWWRPPPSDWAKDLKPIPPGPGNPLGTRWMGLSAPAVGIHATPDASSIGYSASHGCIRMLIPDAEWLFEQVGIGTPVFVVAA